tara:strand:- start:580 stop:1098 length:519 start_codon:yes stop_codon:yes gene_type:complete
MKTKIIWFTGLSGSGKTTLSRQLYNFIHKKNPKIKIKILDGDLIRKKNKKNTFTKKSIIQNNLDIINYISRIKKKYDFILVSVISPLIKTRKIAKNKFKKNYYEIYIKCPIKVLIIRDTKKLYKLALEKKLKNLIGFNSKIKYEKSDYKVLTVNTNILSKNKSLDKIINYIF